MTAKNRQVLTSKLNTSNLITSNRITSKRITAKQICCKLLALSLAWAIGALSIATVAPALAAQPAAKDDGEAFLGENGDMFMEEVTDPKTKPKPKPTIPIDLSRVGVSVDPHGNIVPLKDSADDPWAGSGVKPFVNQIENTFQPLPFYGFAGPTPFGYGVPGYNMPGYANPNLNYRALGNPGYGFGYPGYGGSSYGYPGYGNPYYSYGNTGYGYPYGSAYSPYGYPAVGAPLATFNIGKFQGAIGSSGPGIYPNAANSVFLPSTTNYSQSSMWRAFNLAF